MPDEDSFHNLRQRLQAGEDSAGAEIFARYRAELIRLAAPTLTGLLCHKVDAEDIVQSAFRSFFRVENGHHFTLHSWDDLWSVLATITLRKCRYQVRRFFTAKRDLRRELTVDIEQADVWQAVASEPTPAEAAELSDLLNRLLSELDARSRRIVELSLDGYTVAEIASQIDLTERSVYRQLKRIREQLERFDDSEGQP